MEVWDFSMAMCMPFPMAGMPMRMLMVQGHGFAVQSFTEKPRGRNAFSVPDMVMADLGSSWGDRQYFNLEFMGTAERWLYPSDGYPELLQIGEERKDHRPFLDSQHPHSSPVMGLVLSDTIALGAGKDHLKFWFAPRGESTDGPVAFMHRPTGAVNPDAPLGHHVGQDVGHISSTVIGASLRLGGTSLEASTFHGVEPEPTKVDLPLGSPDSYAFRLTQTLGDRFYAMASGAYVSRPEPHEAALNHLWRFSSSLYGTFSLGNDWDLQDAFVWGMITDYDQAHTLHSFLEEFLFHKEAHQLWGRLEWLQRTPSELAVPGLGDGNRGRWVGAATLGYTHEVASLGALDMGLGGSVTKDFLPAGYRAAYGGDPWTGRIFLRLSGMKMWDL
jgi:hypothetical protein